MLSQPQADASIIDLHKKVRVPQPPRRHDHVQVSGEVKRSPQPADPADSIDRLMEGDALQRDTLQARDILCR